VGSKDKNSKKRVKAVRFLRNIKFQRIFIGIVTLIIAFIIVESGATPEKYNLKLNEVSKSKIIATRDIENKYRTKLNAEAAADATEPVMIEIIGASIDVVNCLNDFLAAIDTARDDVVNNLIQKGITKESYNYQVQLENEQNKEAAKLLENANNLGITLSEEQAAHLVSRASDADISEFKKTVRRIVNEAVIQDITVDNLPTHVYNAQKKVLDSTLNQDMKNIGLSIVNSILKPNRTIDEELTEQKKEEARNDPKNKEIILKGKTIVDVGDVITFEKYQLLEELNLLEESRFDFGLASGIFIILILTGVLLVIYMNMFRKKMLEDRSELLLLSVIILLTLLMARAAIEYSPLAIPIFIATMLISVFLDMKLAMIVNFILTIVISFMTKGDISFIYMALISGSFSGFLVYKANQRNRLFMSGVLVAFLNVVVIACLGIINNDDFNTILRNSFVVFLNGLVSIVLTIGLLPFWESMFNIITPMKLMELANPNQPLIKRLLMEAPGTYHHSLMVGNLAEVATEAIGGNSLLARVGAYFHDVGKLKRPNFFKENQMGDNPHDRMTANLSTLVITSHTSDGVELAEKYKIPKAIKDIIKQHHGTTLVAYFYHKALKNEKADEVKQENFRYSGPKPATREAAVVMLADSVEAAVRSMPDKTEGKIEGFIRKIIKDKLDDGQLDECDLTLKDLDDIAKSFLKVFSGFFHERQEYPEIKIKQIQAGEEEVTPAAAESERNAQTYGGRSMSNGNNNRESAKQSSDNR